jgi:spore germination protein KA
MKSPEVLSGKLKDDEKAVLEKLNYSPDLIARAFKIGGETDAILFYMSGVTDTEQIHLALTALMKAAEGGAAPSAKRGGGGGGVIASLLATVLPVGEVKTESSLDKIANALVYGDGILLIKGQKEALQCAFKKWDKRAVSEPPVSSVIRGPREGFVEDMKTNTGLLRRRLRTEHLIFQQLQIGRFSNTAVTVAHVRGIADERLVRRIMERLKKIDVDGIIDSFYIQQFLEERKGSFLRQIGYCEKPDIAAAKLLEGRIAIFVDGSPAVLTLPYILFEDIQNSADAYSRQPYNNLVILLRVLALAASVLLPGLYVALQVFHYKLLPLKTVVTLSNSIQGTPLPPMLEMLLVIFLFIVVYEAALRMPRYVGMALSIVAAMVLGDTAVKAGILSSFSVLISAVSSVAAHTVPDQVNNVNLLKIAFIVLGGLTGFFGIVLGVLLVAAYATGMDSYGAPYMAPYAPYIAEDTKDGIFRENIGDMKTRPESIPSVNKTRQG